MKHILIAVDLRPSSDRAFERAVQLAEAHDAHLTLVHVIDEQLLAYGDESERFEATLRKRAEARLGRYRKGMADALAGRFRHATRVGKPWEELVDAAREAAADLIVLGLHQPDSLRDLFVGTTAERVIRESPCPALVVRNKPSGPYERVTAATDFSPCSSRALRAALDLAPTATFQLLHVFDTPFAGFGRFSGPEVAAYRQRRIEAAEQQVRRDLEAFTASHAPAAAPRVSVACRRGEVVGEIRAAVLDTGADLLVLGTHGRSAVIASILGSVAVTLLADPPCDLLVAV